MNNARTITRALSATSLMDTDVVNPRGEDLGSIEDMMIDLESGRILYAVLSFGGIFGIGDKLFGVPFEAFTIDQKNEQLILDVSRDRLENAPGFDKDNWPTASDVKYQTEVYRFYGVQPYWT